jgi:dTDP-4-dehydrorhamnose reductase
MTILVTGGRGMLAQALRPLLPRAVFLGRDELDVTAADECARLLAELRPRLVFNLAAYTRVDDAETHEEQAAAVNAAGAGNVARACRAIGARLVHLSTDYVFDGQGTRPWTEDDATGPISAYGRTKLLGEALVERGHTDVLVVRTSWLYGDGGPNFVDTMLRLARERDEIRVVADQSGSPTWTHELAEALLLLGEGGFRGLCHFAGSGQTTWHGFAQRILARTGFGGRLVPVSTEEFPRPAPRPRHSVLDTSRYRLWTGREPRPWQDALDEFLAGKPGLSLPGGFGSVG